MTDPCIPLIECFATKVSERSCDQLLQHFLALSNNRIFTIIVAFTGRVP